MPYLFRVMFKEEESGLFLRNEDDTPCFIYTDLPEAGTVFSHPFPDGKKADYRIVQVNEQADYQEGEARFTATVARLETDTICSETV